MSVLAQLEADFRVGGDARAGRDVAVQFNDGSFSSICPCCGGLHSNFDSDDFGPLAFLNGDDRGGTGFSSKPSLNITDAGAQLTRTNTSWANGLGVATNVTFAFRSSAPPTMPADTASFSRFTTAQITATLAALQSWSDVANITFTQVSNTDGYSNDAVMLFGNYATGQAGAAAFAYHPGNQSLSSNSGDVWVNYTGNSLNPLLLNYGQHTLTHEIGHAIGLSHPAAYNAAEGVSITYGADARYYEDSRQYTVMSYFGEANTGGNFRSSGGLNQYSAVPLLDDIAAAQRLYGANMTTRAEDTVYGFGSNADRPWFTATMSNSVIFAIWDVGGTDTLDFSGYTQAQVIDLRQGSFSNVGGLIGNVAIALGAAIENARGGLGADRLIGNSGDNQLTGNYGNDIIDGGLGIDTAVFLSQRSQYTVTIVGQTVTVSHPAEGTDTIINVEFLRFADQTIAVNTTGGLTVSGDILSNQISGTAFGDTLGGLGGNDAVDGLGGNDVLNGGSGQDTLNGGEGDDVLIGGPGNDALNGGLGWDVADYSTAMGGVVVDLAGGSASGAAGNDLLTGIEEVRGTLFNDILTGNAGANILRGGGGVDTLNGGDGNDQLYSGIGGSTGGAPDIVKPGTTDNTSKAMAVSVDNGFDQIGRSDVFASSTSPHATVVATTHGGVEYYSFTSVTNSSITIDIDNASFDSVIRLYDSNGNLLATNDDGATSGDDGSDTDSALNNFRIPANGIYYVEVSDFSTNTPELTTRPISAGQTYTLHLTVPNHAYVGATEVGSILNGGGGDDLIFTGNARDAVDGGDGVDTVVYDFNSMGHTVTLGTDGVVTVSGNYSGTDTLRNVEKIQFTDRTILVSSLPSSTTGSAGPDRLVGTSANDTLNGLAGNDVFFGGLGSDTLNGGDGIDTAVYGGLRRSYGVSAGAVSGGREGGTDSLTSIEELAFLDGVLTFDPNSNAAAIIRLYDAAFDRIPENVGVTHFLSAIAQGVSLQQIAAAFVQSEEFTLRNSGTTNDQFVRQMFNFALNRSPDQGSVDYWKAYLDSGQLSRSDILLLFSESPEHLALTIPIVQAGIWVQDQVSTTIGRLYLSALDRLPEEYGVLFWRDLAAQGTSMEAIANGFLSSAEFQARFGSLDDRQFIIRMYDFVLGRSVDEQGIQGWLTYMSYGVSRARVLLDFSESPEHVALSRPFTENGLVYQGYAAQSSPIDLAKGSSEALTSPTAPAENHNGGIGGYESVQPLPGSSQGDEIRPEQSFEGPDHYHAPDFLLGFREASQDAFVLSSHLLAARAPASVFVIAADADLPALIDVAWPAPAGEHALPLSPLFPDSDVFAQDLDRPWMRSPVPDHWA